MDIIMMQSMMQKLNNTYPAQQAHYHIQLHILYYPPLNFFCYLHILPAKFSIIPKT